MRKKDLWILFGAIAGALLLVVVQFAGSAIETGAWGLSFRMEGQPPVGTADAHALKAYDAAF